MRKKTLLLICSALILLSLISCAFALTASISNGRMVLYKNISNGEVLNFENSVGVNNNNNFSVEITLFPKDVWNDRVLINENNFSLAPGESREINYTISINKAGYYQGDIVVNFNSDEDKAFLSLAQDLVVIAIDKETGKVPGKITGNAVGESPLNYSLLFGILGAIVVVIIIILIIRRRK